MCQRCGKPSTNQFCDACAAQQGGSAWDAAAGGQTPRDADPYETQNPYDAIYEPIQPAPPYPQEPGRKTSNVKAIAVVGLALALLAASGVALWWLLKTPTAPQPQTSSSAGNAATATVTQTVSPTTTESSEPTDTPEAPLITEEEAVAALRHYFSVVPGDPSAGWPLLSRARQSYEKTETYYDYWTRTTSANVANCSYDPAESKATCDLTVVTDGKAGTSPAVGFYLVREDGGVKIDAPR